MVKFAILTEKPSAMKNFAKALGGNSGTFNGQSYTLVASHGHLLQWSEPSVMVAADSKDKYASWKLEAMPWNYSDFKWKKVPSMGYNPRTKKKESTKKDIDRIKKEVASAESIVIATDVDPSGEGEMIGWEIINAIGWKKPVYRLYHADESEKKIQEAFNSMKNISDQNKDGDYLKADVRSKWDFMSMQLTRIATTVAKGNNVDMVANQGRLKSVIVTHIYEQEQAIKNYVKKPFYEIRFKDENGHIFKIIDEDKRQTFAVKADAERNLSGFNASGITNVKRTQKRQAPPKLLDLSGLSSILAPKGFNPKEVLATYQKMYEDGIVSYPRTEDKFISLEQFNEMLPLIDKIANVIGVDKKFLSHREPRKTHIKSGGAHGANRPGLKVPSDRKQLEKYGTSAVAIYTTLAKSFLAMFGEDYIYNQVTANLTNYPDYATKFNVPLALNYKNIFSIDEESEDDSTKDIGAVANPFVFEGSNKKPQKPTMKWMDSYLTKYNVGTGATRTSTIADLTTRLLTEKKGTLATTDQGKVAAVLAKGTMIADVKITEILFNSMEQVGNFKVSPEKVIASVTELVNHDKPIIVKNGAALSSLGIKPISNSKNSKKTSFVEKDKLEITFNGKPVKISTEWGGHKFTSSELDKLVAGESITFKTAKGYEVSGKLAEQSFKKDGKVIKYVGFAKE